MANKRRQQSRSGALRGQERGPKPYDWEQADRRHAHLPSLLDNFCHAEFAGVSVGPRRELTLTLRPLIWVGNRGDYGSAVRVRFGGIINFEEVEAIFSQSYQQHSELAWLRYDDVHQSAPGDLYVHLEFERVEARVIIHCSKLTVAETVAEAEQPAT